MNLKRPIPLYLNIQIENRKDKSVIVSIFKTEKNFPANYLKFIIIMVLYNI